MNCQFPRTPWEMVQSPMSKGPKSGKEGRCGKRRPEDEDDDEDDEDGIRENDSETKRYNPKQSGLSLRNKGLGGGTNRETG